MTSVIALGGNALMRAGELCARPDRCDWNGGCKYPSVCRSER